MGRVGGGIVGEGQSNSGLRSSDDCFHMRTNSGMHVKPILVCE